MFNERNKGKITIDIDSEEEQLNSSMKRKGLAVKPDIALTTLLINFVSLALEKGKDPKTIIDNNLEALIRKVKGSGNLPG